MNKHTLLLAILTLIAGSAGGFVAGYMLRSKRANEELDQWQKETGKRVSDIYESDGTKWDPRDLTGIPENELKDYFAKRQSERLAKDYQSHEKATDITKGVVVTKVMTAPVRETKEEAKPVEKQEAKDAEEATDEDDIQLSDEEMAFLDSKDADEEYEKVRQSNKEPYIIDEADYFIASYGFEQISIDYYAKDGIFTDAKDDDPIENPDEIFGEDIQNHFGEMSNDPNEVYVRNEKRRTEYVISRREGSYKQEVAGLK